MYLIFGHASGIAFGMVMLVRTPLWSILKYLSNYWIDCRAILYRHLLSLGDKMDFSSSVTSRSNFSLIL